jgi:zinc protease
MINNSLINWKHLPGADDIVRSVLPNGITILSRSNFSSPSVYVTGYIQCGSLQDPPEKLGLANFTARSLMRGTEKRNFREIYDSLETVGASFGMDASVHTSGFSAKSLTEDLPLIMDILSQALRFPTFPADQLEKVRAQLLTSFAMRSQDTSEMADMEFDRLLFPDHPYGRPEDGYAETVLPITADDIVSFHQSYYGPDGMVIVVVGGITSNEVIDLVEKYFGDWKTDIHTERNGIALVDKPMQSIRSHVTIPGMSQTDLVMGTLGPYRTSPDYIPAAVGNNILGQFGMMGRIGDVVREKAGLAYYASTSLNSWKQLGSWEVSAGVNPENLQKAIDLITSEIARFVDEPVTEEEISDSKSNFIGRLPLLMESNGGVAGSLLNIERFQLGLDYYRQYPANVQSVTKDQVLETARKYLNPNALVIASAGIAKGQNGHTP